jgi:hypothetical protein
MPLSARNHLQLVPVPISDGSPAAAIERLFVSPCAAVWSPPGSAERVDGGYRITGRWGYASGVLHAPYALVPAIVDNSAYWFIVARENLKISDDWDMASMVATGSVTIATKNTFVPDGWGIEIGKLMSATGHSGTFHAEDIYRQSFSVLSMATVSLSLGALDAAVELNFLHPIKGTPLESKNALTPERCLKIACLFRLLNPRSEVRAAGGRELNVGARQADLFSAVNSIFVNGYLTTPGLAYAETVKLIERAGYQPEMD